MDPREQDVPTSIGLFLLRLGAGGFMTGHGWEKVQMLLDGRAADFGDPLGLGPTTSLVLAAVAEFLCALLVTVGFATRLATIPTAIMMGVAAFVVYGSHPWTMSEGASKFLAGAAQDWNSKEPALLFLAAFVALFFTGPGQISLDAHLRRRRAQVEAAK